jgi:hypothetical protein
VVTAKHCLLALKREVGHSLSGECQPLAQPSYAAY